MGGTRGDYYVRHSFHVTSLCRWAQMGMSGFRHGFLMSEGEEGSDRGLVPVCMRVHDGGNAAAGDFDRLSVSPPPRRPSGRRVVDRTDGGGSESCPRLRTRLRGGRSGGASRLDRHTHAVDSRTAGGDPASPTPGGLAPVRRAGLAPGASAASDVPLGRHPTSPSQEICS